MMSTSHKSATLFVAISFSLSLAIFAVYIIIPGAFRVVFWFLLFHSILTVWDHSRKKQAIHITRLIFAVGCYLFLIYQPVDFKPVGPIQSYLIRWDQQQIQDIATAVAALFNPSEVEILFVLALLLISWTIAPLLSRYLLRLTSNDYFEFVSCMLSETMVKLGRYVTRTFGCYLLILVLAVLAFDLLGVENFVLFGVVFAFWALVPFYGILAGSGMIVSLLPQSSSLPFQISGVIIFTAVVWFVRYLLFAPYIKEIRTRVTVFHLFLVNAACVALFGWWAVVFQFVPFYLCLIIINHVSVSARLIHTPASVLRRFLTA